MNLFNLPASTIVQRIVPKNSFDSFTNRKQKDLFTRDIAKITWSNSLSTTTTNLPSKDISEIQIFTIALKERKDITILLNVIDKAIPYHIIFIVEFETSIYISTSSKHPSPINEIKSVIDWTFKSDWHNKNKKRYTLELKRNLDYVFYEFCRQLSLKSNRSIKNINDLVQYNLQISALIKDIEETQKSIASCRQFNKKVEMNLKLKQLEEQMNNL